MRWQQKFIRMPWSPEPGIRRKLGFSVAYCQSHFSGLRDLLAQPLSIFPLPRILVAPSKKTHANLRGIFARAYV